MTGPLPDTVTTTARRADYGAVRLGRRDIDGLLLCAEHFGAPYDLLAAALGAQPARLRGIVARWRRAGYAATGRLGPGPAWCWLTGGPASPGKRTAPRTCPAPHQPGHRPNNLPPLPPTTRPRHSNYREGDAAMLEQVPADDADMWFFGPPRHGERLLSESLPEPVAGMNVRYVFRVVSGDRAKKVDARQAEAIMEVLKWIRDHPDQQEQAQPGQ